MHLIEVVLPDLLYYHNYMMTTAKSEQCIKGNHFFGMDMTDMAIGKETFSTFQWRRQLKRPTSM